MKIVTNSANGLPGKIIEEYGIKVIPFPISLGEEAIREDVKDSQEFLKEVKESKLFPKTAALPVEKLAEAYRELGDVLSIHLPRGFSIATYEAMEKAKEMASEARIEAIDSKQICFGLGVIVLQAARLVREKNSRSEIIQAVKKTISRTNFIIALPNLEYLHRGGRIGRAKALLGSLMRVIPLITLRNEEGVFTPLGRARNVSQANARIIEKIRMDMKERGASRIRCLIGHVGDNPEAFMELKEGIMKNFSCQEITEAQISCSAVVYMGPQGWGVGYELL